MIRACHRVSRTYLQRGRPQHSRHRSVYLPLLRRLQVIHPLLPLYRPRRLQVRDVDLLR